MKHILKILFFGFSLFIFQACGDSSHEAQKASETIDDQDLFSEQQLDFGIAAAKDSIPPVSYAYTRSVNADHVHIRFRCPERDGVLYRHFAIYLNNQFYSWFRSGCRHARNSRSIRPKILDRLEDFKLNTVKLVTLSPDLSDHSSTHNTLCFWGQTEDEDCVAPESIAPEVTGHRIAGNRVFVHLKKGLDILTGKPFNRFGQYLNGRFINILAPNGRCGDPEMSTCEFWYINPWTIDGETYLAEGTTTNVRFDGIGAGDTTTEGMAKDISIQRTSPVLPDTLE